MPPAPRVSVIICSRNRAESLRRVLGTFAEPRSDLADVEVLVIDNASTDHTRAVTDDVSGRVPDRFRYLGEPRQGKAFALNTGVAAARGDLLCFTDDDVTIDPGWLGAFRRALQDPACLGAAGRILPSFEGSPPRWLRDGFPFPFRYDFGGEPRDATAPAFGANMAYRRLAFERYGRFREDLGPSAGNPFGLGEDSEFCERLLSAGERVRYVPDALVHHPVSQEQATTGFLRAWHVRLGRALARREPVTPRTPRIWGAPRYLFPALATSAVTWMTSFDRTARLSASLACCRAWGELLEYRSTSRGPLT